MKLYFSNSRPPLFSLEKSQTPEDIRAVVGCLIKWLKLPEQTSLRRAFTVWIYRVLLPARLPGQDVPQVNELVEVETMLAERVKEWTKEWKAEGMQQGMKQGMQKGVLQLLMRQLEVKFDELPPGFVARLKADEEQILLWSERILTADKLSDVFGN